jgi:hypothetical protein
METKSKLAGLFQTLEDLGGFYFLLRLHALAAILIACNPPQTDWHAYCFALGVPILLISLAVSVWRVVGDGTTFAHRNRKPQTIRRHE